MHFAIDGTDQLQDSQAERDDTDNDLWDWSDWDSWDYNAVFLAGALSSILAWSWAFLWTRVGYFLFHSLFYNM